MKKKSIQTAVLLFVMFQGFQQGSFAQENLLEKDREHNTAIIEKLGSQSETSGGNDAFIQLGQIAKDYNLMVGIDKFSTGDKARRQPKIYGGSYKWKFLTSKDHNLLEQYVQGFNKGWVKLPPEFVAKVKLKAIVFVKDLTFAGFPVGGGFGLEEMILFINVVGPFPGEDYVQHIYFHEFFHVLQNKFHGFIDYKKWTALNEKKDPYYPGGAMAMIREHRLDPLYFFREYTTKGFVNNYSRSDVYHDVTETYCYLMITPFHKRILSWAKKDSILKAKMNYLKQAMLGLYEGFTEHYFEVIHQ
ncbi:MAG: hypothetical protein ABUK01_03560 [Leptospirales bacterium]